MFSKVVDAAKKASRHERGPGGEVLVLLSDAYDGPVVFSGPWEEELAEESVKGATDQFRSHPALRRWVDENSFLAVEPITYETYGILGKRKGLMAIFVSYVTLFARGTRSDSPPCKPRRQGPVPK